MGRRHRKRKPPRRVPWRDPKPRILCVCEGEATEPQYLRGFKNWCKNPRVEVVVDDNPGVPLTLVRRAKERKREAEATAKTTGVWRLTESIRGPDDVRPDNDVAQPDDAGGRKA